MANAFEGTVVSLWVTFFIGLAGIAVQHCEGVHLGRQRRTVVSSSKKQVNFIVERILENEITINCSRMVDPKLPVVVNTWNFTSATRQAWKAVSKLQLSALDAVERGCTVCEQEQCDGTVGYGGSPDENGETTLDAMIMDGDTMNIGAVAALRRVKDAISVARHVLERTKHTMLVGDQATEFAVAMGFKEETLQTDVSRTMWEEWKKNNCQPNFWVNVSPDPTLHCGPYHPTVDRQRHGVNLEPSVFSEKNHDTIGMVVIDEHGHIAAGTSTNGLKHKIPGRVGDSPIPGAGAYADSRVGAAAATGDGDVMMRFLPSFLAVEEMRRGLSPAAAGAAAMKRIVDHHPNFVGGIIVVKANGEFGAACHGLETFPYSVCNSNMEQPTIYEVPCI